MKLIAGEVINMGGEDWTVPPLNLRQSRELLPKITGMRALTSDEQYDIIVETITAALSRNYPDITADRVLDILDLGNKERCMSAVLGQSGSASGEATAGSLSTGAQSTAV